MSQKLLLNEFKWIEDNSKFNKDFLKNYNLFSCNWCLVSQEPHNDLSFIPEKITIEKL